MQIRRGDVFFADLDPVIGSEQGGNRPVLVIQNDVGNIYSPTIVIVPLTTRMKKKLSTHVPIILNGCPNVVLGEQMRTISKSRLQDRIGRLSKQDMCKVNYAIQVSIGLIDLPKKLTHQPA